MTIHEEESDSPKNIAVSASKTGDEAETGIAITDSKGVIVGNNARMEVNTNLRIEHLDQLHIQISGPVSMPAESLTNDDEIRWSDAEARYRERMMALHGYIRPLGSSRKIELDGIYVDLYVTDKQSASRRYDLAKLQAGSLDVESLSHKGERQSILSLVKSEKRLFILGKPGSGKTTILKYLTLQTCLGKIEATPVLVIIKEWITSGLELMPFIVQLFDRCGFQDAKTFIEHLLRDGAGLVLFDGLDEINTKNEKGAKILLVLKQFTERYPKLPICITSRLAAVDYLFEEFT